MIPLAALALSFSLHFEPNVGQAPGGVRWTAAANGYRLLLSDTVLNIRLDGGAEMGMSLPRCRPEGQGLLPGKSNYYFGSQTRVGVPHYARVRYRGVYPGIDLEIYGKGQEIEYDWKVAPGADASAIQMRFTGARPRVDQAGDLVFDTSAGQIRHRKPRVAQGEREIAGEFLVGSDDRVGFRLGDYDRTKALVIDPQIVWARGFGGSGFGVNYPGLHGQASDEGSGIAVDSSGNVYVTGTTFSTDFPVVNPVLGPPACITTPCAFRAVFVSKLSADGKTLLYSTYFATTLLPTTLALPAAVPAAIAVDVSGNAYVTGATDGSGVPQTDLKVAGGTDAFLLKLDPKGALGDLRLFGGSGDDAGTALRFAPDGTLLLTGTTKSADFPATTGAFSTKLSSAQDVFLMRISMSQKQSTVLYSTYVGPGDGPALAVDGSANAYVAASTTSVSWPTTAGAAQPKCAGSPCADVAVAKIDASGATLLYGTYWGGPDVDTLGGIAVDGAGAAYVGVTTFMGESNAGFAQVVKLSADGRTILYTGGIIGPGSSRAIAVDAAGNAYVAGTTTAPGPAFSGNVQATPYNSVCPVYTPSGSVPIAEVPCASAGFLGRMTPDGQNLVWFTYLGSGSAQALALDDAGEVFVTGKSIALLAGTVGVVKISPSGMPLTFIEQRPIADGASFRAGLPRPGGLATMFLHGAPLVATETATSYPLPRQLAGVSIFVDGAPAPILAVYAPPLGAMNPLNTQQINFQVPFEAKSNVVEVRYQGMSTFVIPPQVAPGLFNTNGTAAVQHGSDYSLVTTGHPAKKGEVVIFYATGLGLVDPPPVTGAAATQAAPMKVRCSAPSINVGEILYAGITPGFAGLYQLNVRLSETLPSGVNNVRLQWSDCWLGAPPESFYLSNTVMLAVE